MDGDWGDLMTLDEYTEPVNARKPRKRGGAKRKKGVEAKVTEAAPSTEDADRTTETTEPTEEEVQAPLGAQWVIQEAQTRKAALEQRVVAAVKDSKAEQPVLALAKRLDSFVLFGGKWLLKGEDALRAAQHARDDPAQAKLALRQFTELRTAAIKEALVAKTQGTRCEQLGLSLVQLCDRAGAKALVLLQDKSPVTAAQAAAAWSVERIYRPLKAQGDATVDALCSVRSANAEQITVYTQMAKDYKDTQTQRAAGSLIKLKAQVAVAKDQAVPFVWSKVVLVLGEDQSQSLKASTQAAVDKTLPRLPTSLRRFFQPAHAA